MWGWQGRGSKVLFGATMCEHAITQSHHHTVLAICNEWPAQLVVSLHPVLLGGCRGFLVAISFASFMHNIAPFMLCSQGMVVRQQSIRQQARQQQGCSAAALVQSPLMTLLTQSLRAITAPALLLPALPPQASTLRLLQQMTTAQGAKKRDADHHGEEEEEQGWQVCWGPHHHRDSHALHAL